ncbi:HK97 family phage prohead protease [Enterococcus ureasiticus]|uniref:HK97 family phage prohead protease n=1 Tax=Enterococcus ureasiticus TaxID=903984 RepID=UPI001A8D7B64|nr:HK97 family phage prohead protease [Enterococcus ureasiticus]MBO0475392.1 HK97 family phage prohead protease [Enterococcus ureasiticus]
MKKKEVRTFDITNLKTRDDSENNVQIVSGYAAIFNSPTELWEGLNEVISPGAFSKTLSSSDVRCLFDHDWGKVLGRTKSGTLRLEEDERGLRFEVELPNTTVAKDLIESMTRGDINQCSFGFIPTEETWDYNADPVLRTVNEVDLFEVSIVSLPAYEDTEASLARNKQEIQEDITTRKQMIKKIKTALSA